MKNLFKVQLNEWNENVLNAQFVGFPFFLSFKVEFSFIFGGGGEFKGEFIFLVKMVYKGFKDSLNLHRT